MKLKLPDISLKATGLMNLFDVDGHIRKLLSPVINQINVGKADEGELAEVVVVYATEEQLDESPIDDTPDYKFLGAIRFRKIYTQQNLSDDQLMVAYPLNLNIIDFPVKGETVFIQKIYDKFYYTDRVNMFNNPNNAGALGASQKFNIGKSTKSQKTLDTAETGVVENKEKPDDVFLGEYFKPNFNIRQLVPNEGDTLIQGRFGNTLRLGSVDNAPTIKLRAGQISDFDKFDEGNILIDELNEKSLNAPLEENINLDASSMWMTTDETVKLTPATLEDANIYPTSVVPEVFDGKQIILNSGRLIFNSKEDGILGFSNGPIDFSTLNSFGVAAKQNLNLYSPDIKIGRGQLGEDNPGKTKNIILNGVNVSTIADEGRATTYANRVTLRGPLAGSAKQKKPSPAVRGKELREILNEVITILQDMSSDIFKLSSNLYVTSAPGAPTPQPNLLPVAKKFPDRLNKLVDQRLKVSTILSKIVELE
jgi:hypothetical protein